MYFIIIALLIWVKYLRRTYPTITSTRHVCDTDASQMLDIIFTRFIRDKDCYLLSLYEKSTPGPSI